MDFTRRSFLTAPAAAAVLGAQSPKDTINVAMVGVGNRGSFLLSKMLKVAGARVVAVCDILPERAAAAKEAAAKEGQSAEVFTDFRQMLDRKKDIDAVVLATPDGTHKDINIAILEVGKHLYAEKPLALTPGDGRMVVSAVKQAKGIFQIGFQLRHDPNRAASMDFIHKGGIGKVLVCHGMRHGNDLPRDIPWYFNRERNGDIIIDQGIHILDLFTWSVDKHPLRVSGSGGISFFKNDPPGRTVMDNYSVVFEYPDDMRVCFSHHYFDPPGFTGIRERVFGSLGAIDLPAASWTARGKRGEQKLTVPDAGEDSTYMSLKAFIDNVRRNNRKPLNNADSALRSLLVAYMATQAVYQKRIVTWEEVVQG